MGRTASKIAISIVLYEDGVAVRYELDQKGKLIDQSLVTRASSKRAQKKRLSQRARLDTETSSNIVPTGSNLSDYSNLENSSESRNIEWMFQEFENDGNFFDTDLPQFDYFSYPENNQISHDESMPFPFE